MGSVVRYLRNADGRFNGAIPTGKEASPRPAPAIPSFPDFDDPGSFGEVADVDALYHGWAAKYALGSNLPTDAEEESDPAPCVALRQAAEDPELEALYARTDALLEPSADDSVPAAADALSDWEHLQEPLDRASWALDSLEHEIAKRVDQDGISTLSLDRAGISAHPTGGIRYSGWKHEELQSALAACLGTGEEYNRERQVTAAIVGEYFSYATPLYYRVSALQDLGISPDEFATPGQDDRRLVLKGLPDEAEGINAVLLGSRISKHKEACHAALSDIPRLCQNAAARDLPEAVIRYAALRERHSTIRRAVHSLRELARRQMEMQRQEEIQSASGQTYRVVAGRQVTKVVSGSARPFVLDAISRDLAIRRETVERVVTQLESVAQFGSYRIKAIETKTDAPLDACLTQRRTPNRLVAVIDDSGSG